MSRRQYEPSGVLKRALFDNTVKGVVRNPGDITHWNFTMEKRRRSNPTACSPCSLCGRLPQVGDYFFYVTFEMQSHYGNTRGGFVICSERNPCKLRMAVKSDQ